MSLGYMYIIFFCVVQKITIAIKVPKICKKMFPWMKKEDVQVQSTYIYLSQRFSLRRHLRGYLYILECWLIPDFDIVVNKYFSSGWSIGR